MFTTGETVGLAEWIIDDTCLVIHLYWFKICVTWAKLSTNHWSNSLYKYTKYFNTTLHHDMLHMYKFLNFAMS